MSLIKNVLSVCGHAWLRVTDGPHRHHPPTMLHIYAPPPERERGKEGGRQTTHWVGTGVQIRLQSLEVCRFVDGLLMTPVWLQAHCTALSDGQMGIADGLI